jgi:hypothetical protein
MKPSVSQANCTHQRHDGHNQALEQFVAEKTANKSNKSSRAI